MANVVTLTFAGEDKPLTDAFDRVGSSAQTMGDRVGESASGFDRASEASDIAEGRAQGFASTLTGTADIAAGTGDIMKGNLFDGFVTVGGGAADLAEGFNYTVIPALQSMVGWLRTTRVAQLATAGATKVWTAVQWLFNASLWASPITWIVVGVLLLIGVIILIATKTDWFQRLWKWAWDGIKKGASNVWDFIKKIPGWIGTAFSKIADAVGGPFRAAFNFVADAWNNTVGRLSWSVPSWVPFIGGNTISVPNLPKFHAGGRVPGAPGQNVLAMLQAGETVSSAAGRGGGAVIEVRGDGTRLGDALVEILAGAVRRRGGDVQLVLGGSRG